MLSMKRDMNKFSAEELRGMVAEHCAGEEAGAALDELLRRAEACKPNKIVPGADRWFLLGYDPSADQPDGYRIVDTYGGTVAYAEEFDDGDLGIIFNSHEAVRIVQAAPDMLFHLMLITEETPRGPRAGELLKETIDNARTFIKTLKVNLEVK